MQGSSALNSSKDKPKSNGWLTDKIWIDILALCECNSIFNGLDEDIFSNIERWEIISTSLDPLDSINKVTNNKFKGFYALMILRCFRPDAIIPAVTTFIETSIGKKYIEYPQFQLRKSFECSKCSIPIIFVLTPGSDPVTPLNDLARELNFLNKVSTISMGQGQGLSAENAIQEVNI